MNQAATTWNWLNSQIRTVIVENEILFNAGDVCKALGLVDDREDGFLPGGGGPAPAAAAAAAAASLALPILPTFTLAAAAAASSSIVAAGVVLLPPEARPEAAPELVHPAWPLFEVLQEKRRKWVNKPDPAIRAHYCSISYFYKVCTSNV